MLTEEIDSSKTHTAPRMPYKGFYVVDDPEGHPSCPCGSPGILGPLESKEIDKGSNRGVKPRSALFYGLLLLLL